MKPLSRWNQTLWLKPSEKVCCLEGFIAHNLLKKNPWHTGLKKMPLYHPHQGPVLNKNVRDSGIRAQSCSPNTRKTQTEEWWIQCECGSHCEAGTKEEKDASEATEGHLFTSPPTEHDTGPWGQRERRTSDSRDERKLKKWVDEQGND